MLVQIFFKKKKGISRVCFSNDGRKIAACGLDSEHTIVIFDLEKSL